MTVQQPRPAKQDPVLKFTLWFVVAGMVFGMIPMSIAALYSGKAPEAGFFGLVVCLGITGDMLSLLRKDD